MLCMEQIYFLKALVETQMDSVQFDGSLDLLGVITDMNPNAFNWEESQINHNVGI